MLLLALVLSAVFSRCCGDPTFGAAEFIVPLGAVVVAVVVGFGAGGFGFFVCEITLAVGVRSG
jgi:hypothetical protein